MSNLGELTVPTIDQSGPRKTGEFTYIDISSIDNKLKRIVEPKRLPGNAAPSRARQRLQTGDVLVSMTRPNLNAVAIVPPDLKEAVGSTGFHVLRAVDGIESRWLFYAVQTHAFVDAMSSLVQGALYPAVRPKDIRAFGIEAPPLDEQRLIVAEIEKQFSRLDEAVANLKRLKANLKRYKAGVLKAAVEGALVPIKNRQTTKIGEVADLVTKGSSPNWQGFTYTDSGVVFVRSQNVGWGNLDLSDVAHLPPAFNEKERKSVLRTGDVLLNIVGASIGRAAVATPEIEGGNVNQAVAVIRLNQERMLPKYLMLNLLSPGTQAAIHAEKVDVARANVSLSDIKEFSVLFPSLAEQGTMVAEVERRLSVIDELETTVEANLKRADRLRQSVLSRAFEGKLVPQSSSDEPASLLLTRTRETSSLIDNLRPKETGKLGGITMPKPKGKHGGETGQIGTKSLYQVLSESEKHLTPDQLFAKAGFGPELIDEFYEELKRETQTGRIFQERPNNTAVYLKVASNAHR
jgi:type I restriction enzyme S subunit